MTVLLDPAYQMQIAILVEDADVAGPIPVVEKGLRVRCRLAIVPIEYAGAANDDLALLTLAHRMALAIDDRHVAVEGGQSD